MQSVLTLGDLEKEKWNFSGTALAVLGQPIAHSLSPAMHNAALASLAKVDARFANWKYFRIEVAPVDLARALGRLHELGFRGLNLTVPHKVMAVEMIAEIDPAAREAGAVNTLIRDHRGWAGYNTDGVGLIRAIEDELHLSVAGRPMVLLGAGGAARGAAVALLREKCASLHVINRSRPNLDALLEQIRPIAGTIPVKGLLAGDSLASLPPETVVINATSLGLRPDDEVPVDFLQFIPPAAVFDMIYNPPVTPFLDRATMLGIPGANGMAMLVHQGAKALEIWSGAPASQTAPVMYDALEASFRGQC